jgi:hypothetical protein
METGLEKFLEEGGGSGGGAEIVINSVQIWWAWRITPSRPLAFTRHPR